ncbi:unnamed protein product [Microthlaspi erraticum]|uniref:Arabidopsis retrotransposon Orf1 C-terminal domain-containing protein n=1 Tax=Microthlaspi erraticum TaxID=1685480 RepID=A0A6D2KGU5_9BRAS|nr:unnamed protein product [Microthlaspi erraticum]
MTNSEGSRASQRRMVEGESSNARERRLKMQADLEGMNQRMKSLRQRREEVIKVDESGKSNQDEPMEEAEPQEEEDELPMYQEHYNALFSMDFVETKYPHDDTMKALGIFEDVELGAQEHAWPSSSLTAWSLQGAHL